MRLLYLDEDGKLSLTEDLIHNKLPPYAALSHTWHEEEVTYDDVCNGTGLSKAGYSKIQFCAQQAHRDGLRYFWIDACCIDKANFIELQHAINSVFGYFRGAARCYVLLSDVPSYNRKTDSEDGELSCMRAFRYSRWFTRAWTLQELLAPHNLIFFSRNGEELGSRADLREIIHQITNIPIPALDGIHLDYFSVEERLSWAHKRNATRPEDHVYSLLGLFGVFMPPMYGEGRDNAFKRLRREIQDRSVEGDEYIGQRLLTYQRLDAFNVRVLVLHPKTAGRNSPHI